MAAVQSALRGGIGTATAGRRSPVRSTTRQGRTERAAQSLHTRRPAFKPTLPGRYTLRLTVTTDDGTRASGTVDVWADPTPAVPMDTLVRDSDR